MKTKILKKSEKFKTEMSKILKMTKTLKGKIISEIEKKIEKTGADEIILDDYISLPYSNPLFYDNDSYGIFESQMHFYIEKVSIYHGAAGKGGESDDWEYLSFSELDIDVLFEILEEIEASRFSLVDEDDEDEEDEEEYDDEE